MNRLDAGFALALLCFVVACRADPGLSVRPMAASPANVTDISEEVIPLDQVSKSQAAVIGQRVATTEITVTYHANTERGFVFIDSRTLAPRFNDHIADTGE